ncbi:MAG: hypothetical protein KGL39_57500, partial [Patescibacteria group bacterium]|nr:hypothetical protein [Patescibacteria group bacterium]
MSTNKLTKYYVNQHSLVDEHSLLKDALDIVVYLAHDVEARDQEIVAFLNSLSCQCAHSQPFSSQVW